MDLGSYIADVRRRRGMSKADVARALKVAWSTVNDWEQHGAVPNRENLVALADLFRLDERERAGLFAAEPSAVPPPSLPPRSLPPRSRPKTHQAELDALLTRALNPACHTIADAAAVLAALSEATAVLPTLADQERAARAWLDAAARLRAAGFKVTAAALAVLLPDVAAED